jgi:hypothetical protein
LGALRTLIGLGMTGAPGFPTRAPFAGTITVRTLRTGVRGMKCLRRMDVAMRASVVLLVQACLYI